MQSTFLTRGRSRLVRIACAVACSFAATTTTGAAFAADDAPQCDYPLALRALTGPQGADLTVRAGAATGCAPADVLKKVQVKVYAADGKLAEVFNLVDVPSSDAIALGTVERGRRIEADALVQNGDRTHVSRGEAITRLRPDLVVADVDVPPQTLTTRPVDVVAEIAERNGETAADAVVKLTFGDTVLETAVHVPAGGSTGVSFAGVALTTATPTELTLTIVSAAPAETNAANNNASASVDVSEHELELGRLVLASLGGFGAQLNGHVYAGVTPAPPGSMPDLEDKVKALEPQIVRIFYSEQQELTPARYDSFVQTVRLAQEAGATINITYQSAARAKNNPTSFMSLFAGVLHDLVEVEGLSNVRWVTVQNEPNRTNLTLGEYETLNRVLQAQMDARGIGEHIGIMAGDLVEFGELANIPFPDHHTWWDYLAANMSDIVDAYSVHVYWNYWDTPRFEYRLRDVREIVDALPAAARKPVFVTEFGVRGILNWPGKPAFQPGYWEDGTPLARTNLAAFQQLWFSLAASQLGFTGVIKWDAYWGRYDGSYNGQHYLIGPPEEGWPLLPAYHALRLLLQTTARDWQVVGVAPWTDDDARSDVNDTAEKEIAAYAGPGGRLTLAGLDSNGAQLNGASSEIGVYSVGGLPPGATFNLATWNAAGSGVNAVDGTVTTSAAGVARFEVPLHAAFALTTVPVS